MIKVPAIRIEDIVKAPAIRIEDIATVGDLRAVLAQIEDSVTCGPYLAEYSPSDHQLDLYPTDDEND